jgi:hypothetical protein
MRPRSEGSRVRIVLATLLAPMAAPALYVAGTVAAQAIDPVRGASAFSNLAEGILVVFAAGAPVAYGATLLALPVLWITGRLAARGRSGSAFTWLTTRRAVLIGFAIGAAVAWALEPWLRGELFSISLPRWAGGSIGAATAAIWWWLAARTDHRDR